jgi:hypothetical protein
MPLWSLCFSVLAEIPQEDWVLLLMTARLHMSRSSNGLITAERAACYLSGKRSDGAATGCPERIGHRYTCFMGDNDSELVRLQENLPSPVRNIGWLPTQGKRNHSAVVVMVPC